MINICIAGTKTELGAIYANFFLEFQFFFLFFSILIIVQEYQVTGENPVLNLQPVHVDKQLDIYAALQGSEDTDKFNLYNKHGIPDQYKYKNNDRVTDIVLVAKEGFAFASTFYKEVKELNLRYRFIKN